MTKNWRALGEALQVTNSDHCLHIVMVICEEYRRFLGDFEVEGGTDVYRRFQANFFAWEGAAGRRLRGRIFPWKEYIMMEENFHEGGRGIF